MKHSMQLILTPDQGKELIARAVVAREDVQTAMKETRLVIVAGTTNAHVARLVLEQLGCAEGFCADGFMRGATKPAGKPAGEFIGDVIIEKSVYLKGKTIADIGDTLGHGDMILKGANALDLATGETAVLIGSPVLGTAGFALRAAVGRKAKLLVPVGVEKRIGTTMAKAAALANDTGHVGPGLLPLPGEAVTEIDALKALLGVQATLVAAGGIWGCEGAAVFAVEGTEEQLAACRALAKELQA